MHASATSFEENQPDSTSRQMFKFRVMQMHTMLGEVSLNIVSHLVLLGVVEEDQLENSRL